MNLLFFQWGVFSQMFNYWQQAGVFQFVLPFLLIFSLIFAILQRTEIFKDRIINIILALVVGLMALQFPQVSQFFADIFPRLGMALGALLVIVILLGMFFPLNNKWVVYSMMGVGIILVAVVLSKTVGVSGLSAWPWLTINWPLVVFAAVFLIIIILVVRGSAFPEEAQRRRTTALGQTPQSLFFQGLADAAKVRRG